MIKLAERIKDKLCIMSKLMVIMIFLILTNSSFSQNINLSNGIGEVNRNYTYGKLIDALGVPDSVYSFDPKNQNPMPKSLAYHEFYFDNNLLMVRFSYFMLDTLTKKSRGPSIMLFNGSSITLNGDALSDLDSAYVVRKYGIPESVLNSKNELTISYSFTEKKYFSLLTFYFSINGAINKIRIAFGKYL